MNYVFNVCQPSALMVWLYSGLEMTEELLSAVSLRGDFEANMPCCNGCCTKVRYLPSAIRPLQLIRLVSAVGLVQQEMFNCFSKLKTL